MRIIIFLAIALLIFAAVDFYAFEGFKHLFKGKSDSVKQIANIVYWSIPIILWGIIITLLITLPAAQRTALFKWTFTFIVGFFLAKLLWGVFLLLDDGGRAIRWISKNTGSDNPDGVKISRSRFMVLAGATSAGLLFSGLLFGIVKGAHNYKIVRRKLKLKNLPSAFNGLKIAQISDVHSGSFWDKSAVNKGIDLILEQKPDVIFFTGDLVNNKASEFEEYKKIFGRLQAKHGVYSILGNHDYGDYYTWPDSKGMSKQENLDSLIQHHKDMNWEILLNQNKVIEKDGSQLAILGVENWSAKRNFPKYGSLAQAYKGVEYIENKLLLSHDPSHWKAEVTKKYKDIDATFSGHTHGMQFGIDTKFYKWSPIKFVYPEWADLYQEGNQYLYVNRGFGYLGFPGRVGVYPEITVFELESC